MPSRIARHSSSEGRYTSHRGSSCSTKATPSSSLSSSSHSRALACPTADPERVVLLRGFYRRSPAADLRQVCEQDFGPVYVPTPFAIPLVRHFTNSHGCRRQVLLFQGEVYPEAFVEFVHRRHAAQCTIHWAKPMKIYRAKDRLEDGTRFINWSFGVTGHSYKPLINDKDWARAWKERDRIERGELPREVLVPRCEQASVREGEERRIRKKRCQARCPSASKSHERQQQSFRDYGSTGVQDRHSSPLITDAGVVGDTSVEIDTVLSTGTTPVDSPSKYTMTEINIDEFLEKIVEGSDMKILSFAKAALEHAAQNFMDTVEEFDALAYKHCVPAKAEHPGVLHSGSFCAGETSIEGAAGNQNAIGLVQGLFQIQQMIELGLRI